MHDLHPKFLKFEERFRDLVQRRSLSTHLFRVYVFNADDTLVHEFKRVEQDLYFDDAGSELELDFYHLLSNIAYYLSEGLEVHVYLSDDWINELYRVQKGEIPLIRKSNYYVWSPRDFLDLIDDKMSEIDRVILVITKKSSVTKSSLFNNLVDKIKGTDALREKFTDLALILENWQGMYKHSAFLTLVDAIKGTELFKDRLNDLIAIVNKWSDGVGLSKLIPEIKGTDLFDEKYPQLELLVSNFLNFIEKMPGSEKKRGKLFQLVRTIQGTRLFERFKPQIEPLLTKSLVAIKRRVYSHSKRLEVIIFIRGMKNTVFMEIFHSQINSLFSEILTAAESDLDKVIQKTPYLSHTAYRDRNYEINFLIRETKDTNLLTVNYPRVKQAVTKLISSIDEIPLEAEFGKSNEFKKMLETIKGTELVKEFYSNIDYNCNELLTELEKYFKDKKGALFLSSEFISFVEAIKETFLIEKYSSRIESLFLELVTVLEQMPSAEAKPIISALQRTVKNLKAMEVKILHLTDKDTI